ncbi:MAG: toxic anion resistance protein [Elioraea sp.]|nr:toxic anion resistance protein [Elioraea sp.]MDW8444189.1 toxic anion resistance protein [Acetobacteraceae bacterium]
MTDTAVPIPNAIAPSAIQPQADALVSYREAPPERRARIEAALATLDLKDSNAVLTFGAKAQEQLALISDQMLEGVRTKDAGAAGNALSEMVATLRGFDVEDARRGGFLSRLFGAASPIARILQRYEEVRGQIDAITDRLEEHKTKLMTDIAALDRLYEATLGYFHVLADYIAAGEEALRRLDEQTIPALEREVQASGDALKAQELRDLRARRDDLERRVHDLKLTRQVAMQSLPSIRLVQENDKALIGKITSTIANTVPLWRTQLAQAVTIARSQEAGKTLRAATDLTNDLLRANAENLRQANKEIREQVERGVFDIDTIKKANEDLIATINESLAIAEEGKRKRTEAEKVLIQCETELKRALAAAKARTSPPEGAGAKG